jgi:DNA-directed RNA polymerase subunit beta
MNVGKSSKPSLGWACAGLGKQVGDAVNAYLRDKNTKPLRDKLIEIYEAKTDHGTRR